jgi:hypothetical protein
MKNGRQATIINYHSSQKVDVQFEDGVVRSGVTYYSFKNGNVSHPDDAEEKMRNKRLGEARVMNSGERVEIIAYRTFKDVDVQFEDGVVVKNVKYNNFKKGSILHPSNTPEAIAERRIGETNTMSSGVIATIIAYRSSSDMDVEFSDGSVREHVRYDTFKNGQIAPPNQTNKYLQECRVGETNTMRSGLVAKIIKYNSYNDIDVKFEDGAVRRKVCYKHFLHGSIAHPNETRESNGQKRIGEKRLMNCGMSATIIFYKNSHDIDVQFEDGMIVKHKEYRQFTNGTIRKHD